MGGSTLTPPCARQRRRRTAGAAHCPARHPAPQNPRAPIHDRKRGSHVGRARREVRTSGGCKKRFARRRCAPRGSHVRAMEKMFARPHVRCADSASRRRANLSLHPSDVRTSFVGTAGGRTSFAIAYRCTRVWRCVYICARVYACAHLL